MFLCLLLGLLFNLEDGDSTLFRNVGKLLPDCRVLIPRDSTTVAVDCSHPALVFPSL
jgi:hypothetical protein